MTNPHHTYDYHLPCDCLTEDQVKWRNHSIDEPPRPSGIWRAVAWCIVIEAVAGMAVWGVIWGMR